MSIEHSPWTFPGVPNLTRKKKTFSLDSLNYTLQRKISKVVLAIYSIPDTSLSKWHFFYISTQCWPNGMTLAFYLNSYNLKNPLVGMNSLGRYGWFTSNRKVQLPLPLMAMLPFMFSLSHNYLKCYCSHSSCPICRYITLQLNL